MDLNEPLSEKNFLLFAMKNYTNSSGGEEEFYDDISRVRYVKRLLGRYDNKRVLKERLILNHIIILANVFGPANTSRILFYKIEKKLHSYLKTFLLFLNYLPEENFVFPEINVDEIPVDLNIVKILREIWWTD